MLRRSRGEAGDGSAGFRLRAYGSLFFFNKLHVRRHYWQPAGGE